VGELILKITGVEQSLSATANTVGDASFVRLLNSNTGPVVVTQQNVAANTANSTYTLASGGEVFIKKAPIDTLTAAADGIVAVSVKRF
jgi:hypothetical protein